LEGKRKRAALEEKARGAYVKVLQMVEEDKEIQSRIAEPAKSKAERAKKQPEKQAAANAA
jgi:hypothetical protein